MYIHLALSSSGGVWNLLFFVYSMPRSRPQTPAPAFVYDDYEEESGREASHKPSRMSSSSARRSPTRSARSPAKSACETVSESAAPQPTGEGHV